MTSNIDFKTIVPAAQRGDKAAWDKLMTGFYAWSVTQARHIARDSEQAKDIALGFWEWMRTQNGIRDYDPAKGSFYTWMGAQLRYRALDAMKVQKPRLVYSEANDPDSFEPDPETGVMAMQDLNVIADKLGPTQRDVFWLLLEGETVEAIASALEVSEKRARNLIGEVRAAITAQRGD